jgi:hypothetical protein
MKNAILWYVTPCDSCKTDISEKRGASIIRVTRIGKLGFLRSVPQLLVTAKVPSSPILFTLMMQGIRSSETSVLTRATQYNIQEDGILQQLMPSLFVKSVQTDTNTNTDMLLTLHRRIYHDVSDNTQRICSANLMHCTVINLTKCNYSILANKTL